MKDVLLLEGRPVTVGSSDVSGILGVSKWSNPWSTWCRLVGLTERYGGPTTDAMKRGNMLENSMGQRWCDENPDLMIQQGLIVYPGPKIPMPGKPGPHPFMSCRDDFSAYEINTATLRRVIEGKSTRYFDSEDGWTVESAPIWYVTQVFWQFACLSPTDGGHIAAYATVLDEYRDYRIERNERLERRLVARCWDWYEKYVLTGQPPPIDGSDACADGLSKLYSGPDDDRKAWKKAKLTPDNEDLALQRDIHVLNGQIEALQDAVGRRKNALRAKIGSAYGIKQVAVYYPVTRTSVDVEKLRQKYPLIAEELTVTAPESRVLKVLPPFTEDEE